jgi:hypothetical protein
MMNRNNVILSLLLLVQFGFVVWVFRPTTSASATVAPLVTNVDAGSVSGLTIADATTQVKLVKVDGQWVVPDAANYSVREASVTQLISDVLAIDTGRLVARTPASHARLKVAPNDFVRRLEVQTADGKQHVLLIGSSPTVNTTHVRVDGQDEVYLMTGALAGDARTDLAGWIDTAYVHANPDEIARLSLANAAGVFDFAKGGDGTWTLPGLAEGETVNQDAIGGLASRLANINLTRPLGTTAQAAYGLAAPAAVVTATVQPEGGTVETVTLTIGTADAADNTYVAKVSTSDYYASVADFQVQDFVGKTRPDFVVPPPAATEAVTATQMISGTGVVTP